MVLYTARNVSTAECKFGIYSEKSLGPLTAFQAILSGFTSLVFELFVIDDLSDLWTTKMTSLVLASVNLVLNNETFKILVHGFEKSFQHTKACYH